MRIVLLVLLFCCVSSVASIAGTDWHMSGFPKNKTFTFVQQLNYYNGSSWSGPFPATLTFTTDATGSATIVGPSDDGSRNGHVTQWLAGSNELMQWGAGTMTGGPSGWGPCSITVTYIGPPECDPQPGPVAFELSGGLIGSGANVEVALYIDKEGGKVKAFSFTQRSGPLDQPAPMYAVPSIPGLPGQFAYEWYVGDEIVATGVATCGEPVPNGKFSDNVGQITTDGPYIDTPPEAEGPEYNNNQTPPPSEPGIGENGGSVTSPPPKTPPAPTPNPPVTADPPPPSNPYTGNTSGGSPGSTLSGNMTKDDFYQSTRAGTSDAIKDNLPKILGAISNAGGGGEPPGDVYKDSNGNSAKFRVPEDGSVRQAEGTLSGKVSAVSQKISEGRQQVTTAVGKVSEFASKVQGAKVPTPDPGKTLDGFKVAFRGIQYSVDLSPYETVIDWLRQLCLMAVTFAFWKYEVKIITQAFQV